MSTLNFAEIPTSRKELLAAATLAAIRRQMIAADEKKEKNTERKPEK